ncbi:plastocyanin/azurin family copper-binding protein [Solirubrobacter phytolaccae]|uniref:Plastocyanin/azurin family copper-binding protein n=1 Tax=Solirubrobacter phytolaccae TaxID=1404360 RepID=A0A9X3S8I8_9ACTN|nr:plastocyanin/azurin family copper-binding protein [Solirubrobacter phytolaccae]MDA0182254.1 plastocyanin/azurin family copper-binding protein [Solirubrobacter phytolaccae]
MVGYVGVAGASEPRADETIGVTVSNEWAPKTIAIETGDTVTFDYSASAGVQHNRKGETGPAEDTTWFVATEFKASGTDEHTFNLPGEYTFICQAHTNTMTGTITVTGDPVEPTPTPTATPTRTATPVPTVRPTVTPAPTPAGENRDTPAPQGAARADTVPPALTNLKLKAQTRGAKVSFKLSESAAVTLRVKRGKATVRTVRASFRAGGGSVTLRRLPRGSYKVEIEARDARGNRAAVQRKTVKVTR